MRIPALRLPARIVEHPVESLVASLLLLALLFVAGEPPQPAPVSARVVPAASP